MPSENVPMRSNVACPCASASPAGKDATEEFEEIGHSRAAKEMLGKYYIGEFAVSCCPGWERGFVSEFAVSSCWGAPAQAAAYGVFGALKRCHACGDGGRAEGCVLCQNSCHAWATGTIQSARSCHQLHSHGSSHAA